MAVYKEEKTGTWRVIYRYTDWTGEKKQTQKRGFQTKREAQAWEREQLNKARADLDMTFKSFVEQYTADMQTRIKENTWATKEHIIRSKLLPYFGKLEDSGTLEKAAAEMMSANARYLIKGKVIFTENYIFCKCTGWVLRYDEILWAYKYKLTDYTIVASRVSDSLELAIEGIKEPIDVVTIGKDKDHEIEIAILEIYRHNKHCLIGYTDENIRKYKEMIK